MFEPALDTNHWRRPAERLVSLFKDAERARCQAIEAEVAKLQKVFEDHTKAYLEAAIKKELAKFPEKLRNSLRAALDTPPGSRSDEQKRLLASHPTANITEGVLYQYDPGAADARTKELAKITAKRAEKPVEDFVSVLDEIPGIVPVTRIFHRGDHRQPTKPVGPGDLTIAAPEGARYEIPEKDPKSPTSGRRLAYARHLVQRRPSLSRPGARQPDLAQSLSAADSSIHRATSACWAPGRPIRNCSTGSPTNWCARAGRSSVCTS